MKKWLVFALCVTMLAMTGVLCAAAEFTPVGDLEIEWDPDVADKIVLDGDITDWQDAGYAVNKITADNMFAWIGFVEDDFEISAHFVSDSEFLYVAFRVVDDDFIPGTDSGNYHDGDAFEIGIDFNRGLQRITEEYPDVLGNNEENIYYSVYCHAADEFVVYRQRKLINQPIELLCESNGDGVKGAGAEIEGGWCVEFALSWEMLYDDFIYKAYADDYVALLDADNDLQLGITLCYIDWSTPYILSNAFGTLNEEEFLFVPASNGMILSLKWEEGMTMNCAGIVTPAVGEEYVTSVKPEETTAEPEVATEKTTEPEKPTENESNLFADFNHLDRFSSEHADYFKSAQCNPIFNADGTVTFTGTWGIDAYVEPAFTIDYYRLMQNFNGSGEKFNKNKLANARGDGNVVVFKVKGCPIMAEPDSVMLHLTAGLGGTLSEYYVYPSNTIKGDGSEEYIYYDLTGKAGYENLFINSLELNWAYSFGEAENLRSTCTLVSIDMYATMEEALAATDESLPGNEETTTSPEESTAEPETTQLDESSAVEPEDTTTEPEETTVAAEDTATEPEETTVAAEDTATEPAVATKEPAAEDSTTAEPANEESTTDTKGCSSSVSASAIFVIFSILSAACVLGRRYRRI